MTRVSIAMGESFNMKQQRLFSDKYLPAGVTFDAMAISPDDPNDFTDMSKWIVGVDYVYFF